MDVNVRAAATQGKEDATVVVYTVWPTDRPMLREIVTEVLPCFFSDMTWFYTLFPDTGEHTLGVSAEFSDLFRSVEGLRPYLWDDLKTADEETVPALLKDALLSLLQIIAMRERAENARNELAMDAEVPVTEAEFRSAEKAGIVIEEPVLNHNHEFGSGTVFTNCAACEQTLNKMRAHSKSKIPETDFSGGPNDGDNGDDQG